MRTALIALATLFAAPAFADAIVPLDGTWTTKASDIDLAETCPAMMAPMLEPMANAMAQEQTQEITFDGVFDPNALTGDQGQDSVTWTQTGENSWSGEMIARELGSTFATMELTAVSESLIEGEMIMNIGDMFAADPDMAEMAALAADCTVSMKMTSIHGG